MSHTVYIFGAGFSVCGGAPKQNDIYPKLFSANFHAPDIVGHKERLSHFLQTVFKLNLASQADLAAFELENIFTILDKCLINREGLGHFNIVQLEQLRQDLNKCINTVVHQMLEGPPAPFYRNLADAILKKRVEAGQEDDPFAFISLNWDIIFDNAIYRAYRNPASRDIEHCRVDYCCYTTPLDMPDHNHSSIEVKRQGYYNIKIQKLHGSLNWLACTNCGILYYKMESKIAMMAGNFQKCCNFCGHDTKAILLQPTFIKDLNNTHLKMVWHNALIDLIEAKRIVFIGYSLPLADFEFRYILKRGIDPDAKINVVLHSSDKNNFAHKNFKTFFGSQVSDDDFCFDGASAFLAKEFDFEFDDKRDCFHR